MQAASIIRAGSGNLAKVASQGSLANSFVVFGVSTSLSLHIVNFLPSLVPIQCNGKPRTSTNNIVKQTGGIQELASRRKQQMVVAQLKDKGRSRQTGETGVMSKATCAQSTQNNDNFMSPITFDLFTRQAPTFAQIVDIVKALFRKSLRIETLALTEKPFPSRDLQLVKVVLVGYNTLIPDQTDPTSNDSCGWLVTQNLSLTIHFSDLPSHVLFIWVPCSCASAQTTFRK